MNAADVLKYGHKFVLDNLQRFETELSSRDAPPASGPDPGVRTRIPAAVTAADGDQDGL